MEGQSAKNARCRLCVKSNNTKTEYEKRIIDAHSQGLGNREIAREVGCHHSTVRYHLQKLALSTNRPRGKPPIEVSPTTAICSSCGKEVNKGDFALVRSHADGRRLSKCRSCRRKREYFRLSNNMGAYLRNKEFRCKAQAKKRNRVYSLPDGYITELYERQKGLCFYTDTPLLTSAGDGRIPEALSVDRVDSNKGYIQNNVVLCTARINSIKKDLTLEEMAMWMPEWYKRIMNAVEMGYITL